jgi:hypothetical protein
MSATDHPSTPLELPASDLDDGFEKIQDNVDVHGGSTSKRPAQMVEDGTATIFSLPLLGREFYVLAYIDDSYYNGKEVSTYLYEADTNPLHLDDIVRNTDYLVCKRISSSDLSGDDASEDTEHLLATCIGYMTRFLLDGRKYQWRTSAHEEPHIETL